MQDRLNTGKYAIEMVRGKITRGCTSERMRKNGWERLQQENDKTWCLLGWWEWRRHKKPHQSVEAAFIKE